MKIELIDKQSVIDLISTILLDGIDYEPDKRNKEYRKGYNTALLEILDEVAAL